MTEIELKQLYKESVLEGRDLVNQQNRTLMFGCTVYRDYLHVYLFEGKIYIGYMGKAGGIVSLDAESNRDYLPKKRAFPEFCDYEFCQLLRGRGLWIDFGSFDADAIKSRYGENDEYLAQVLPEHE